MNLILTFFTTIMMSILLLGCTDSKENDSALTNKNNLKETQITSRAVAQHYQVAMTQEGGINCFVVVTQKDSKVFTLESGQRVLLATGDNIRLTIEGVIWLRVIPNSDDPQACYVQTIFLDPIADYSSSSDNP